MPRPILNLADVEFHDWGHGERYAARLGDIGRRLGAQKLGYNLTVLPPGKRAFPFHSHRVNEEMFFVVAGTGELRLGGERHPIRAGDVIACPPGGKETAHQIINTSPDAELRFLAVSTRQTPELAEYPDSGKYAVFTDISVGGGPERPLRFVMRKPASMEDYWEGE